MTPEQLAAIQRPEPERRAAVAYAIRDTLPTRNAWDMADAAIEAAGVPALLAHARDLEARVGRVEAVHVREVLAVHESHGEEAWCPACRVHWPCPTSAALTATEES